MDWLTSIIRRPVSLIGRCIPKTEPPVGPGDYFLILEDGSRLRISDIYPDLLPLDPDARLIKTLRYNWKEAFLGAEAIFPPLLCDYHRLEDEPRKNIPRILVQEFISQTAIALLRIFEPERTFPYNYLARQIDGTSQIDWKGDGHPEKPLLLTIFPLLRCCNPFQFLAAQEESLIATGRLILPLTSSSPEPLPPLP